MKFLQSPTERFRIIAILEGISFLALLLVAMPLKYLADNPLPVKYTGWVHGILFMMFLVALLQVWIEEKWKPSKAFMAFVSSVVPAAPFIFIRYFGNDKKQ